MIVNDDQVGKGMDEHRSFVLKVLSQNLLGGTEKNRE
jgi:hypothetical protein